MGKKKSSTKESENGNYIKLNESLVKNNNSNGRPKASVLASLFFIVFIGILSLVLGLIIIEINSSNKDINKRILKHDETVEGTLPLHVKESESKDSAPVEKPTPKKSESREKMDNDKSKRRSDADADSISEPSVKKLKIEESIVKEPKVPDAYLPVDQKKQMEIESQIVKDSPDEMKMSKDKKQIKEKNETSTSTSAKEKPKDEKLIDSSVKKPEEKKSETTLKELYIEVESLAEDILQEDPENSMVKELAPHLEGVLRDLEGGKLSGLRDSLLHIKVILSDLKERLEDDKRQKKLDKSKPPKADVSTKSGESRVPVDEVIPDPVYIAPLGDVDEDPSHRISKKESIVDKDPKVKEKVTEKTHEQSKKSSEVNGMKSKSVSPAKEKEQKLSKISQEKKTTEKSSEEIKPSQDSTKDPNLSKEKYEKESQNINSGTKDKPTDHVRSGKVENNIKENQSKIENEKKSSLEAETKDKAKNEEKLKVAPEKVAVEEEKQQEKEKTNLHLKQTKKSKMKESEESQKDVGKSSEKQPSKESLSQQESATVRDSNTKLNNDVTTDKTMEDKKTAEKTVKTDGKNPSKVDSVKTDPKLPQVDSEVKGKTIKEQNIKTGEKAFEEKNTQVPATEEPKRPGSKEDKTSVPTIPEEKASAKTTKKNEEVKSSEIDEKLKLASALADEVPKSAS